MTAEVVRLHSTGTPELTVAQAKAIAAEWVDQHNSGFLGFRGAYLAGSMSSKPDTEPFPLTSDVDIRIVIDAEVPDPILHPENPFRPQKLTYRQVTLEPSFVCRSTIMDPATVLSDMHLAPALANGSILRDPQGLISVIHNRIAPEFPRRKWIAARCDHALADVMERCGAAKSPPPPRIDPLCWKVGCITVAALGTSWIPVVASLGNLTSRKAFIVSRSVLSQYRMVNQADRLLDLLGSSAITCDQAADLLSEMTQAYDEAVQIGRTAFHCSYDVSTASRAIAIDGVRELLRDFPGEAMFLLAFIRTLVQIVFSIDAPPEQAAHHRQGYNRLLRALGLSNEDQIAARLNLIRATAQDFRCMADQIIKENTNAIE
jgi:hypothetical protein